VKRNKNDLDYKLLCDKQNSEIKQLLQIECDNRKEIDYLKKIIEELHHRKCDHQEYEHVIDSKDKEIDFLRKANEDINQSLKDNRDYYENIIRAKDKEIDHTKRNLGNEEYYINKLSEREQELGNLTVMLETLENEKNNLLNRVLNFIDSTHRYMGLDKFGGDEISLTELTLFFNNMSEFIEGLMNENKSLIHKNNSLEEEILRLNNQMNLIKQDNVELR
jgi:Fe2+ transport system protein B